MGKITEIKEGKRNKERINIYIEEEFAFAVYLDTALSNHLKKGLDLSEEDVARIICEDGEKYAIASALKYLSYRMRTERELRDKLKSKEIPADVIDITVEKLKELGYLDDMEFAKLYVQELMQKYGKRVVVQKLLQKGILREIAEAALESMPQEQNVINQYVERLKQKYKSEEEYNGKQKIVRALMSKGFDYEDIKSALLRYEER